MKLRVLSAFVLALRVLVPSAQGDVVINEIFYHAPDDLDGLEWIELHNTGDKPVDLSGWRFSEGVEFAFPRGAAIPANGYLVVAGDTALFREFYDVPVAGQFKKSLSNSGESVALADAQGRRVDRVTYTDSAPWPASADGESASLERICPTASGESPHNWAASPLSDMADLPSGTPGARNASCSATLPPVIEAVNLHPKAPRPGQPIRVEAALAADSEPAELVELRFRSVAPGKLGEEQALAMRRDDSGRYVAEIPGQPGNQLLRVRVRAVGPRKAERFFPHENALRPALSLYVAQPITGTIPHIHVIHPDPDEQASAEKARRRALSMTRSPFEQPGAVMADRALAERLDLRQPWFEWTVNRPPDPAKYSALRKVLTERETERRMIQNAIRDASDPAAALRESEGRIPEWQEKFAGSMRETLDPAAREEWDRWLRDRRPAGPENPGGLLSQILDIESVWLGLNLQFELAEPSRAAIVEAFRSAAKRRAEQLPTLTKLMRGEGNFFDLQNEMGRIEAQLKSDLQPLLTLRQRRFLEQRQRDQGSPIHPRTEPAKPVPARGVSAFVHMDPKSGEAEVHDFVTIRERSAGWKVRFPKDHPFHGMTTANVIFEHNDRFVLAEPLAFELYRRAGSPSCNTEFARLHLNGQPAGYHLIFEQVNRAFLRRNGLNPDGDLFKIAWYGQGLRGQHEMQNHSETGHDELARLVELLNGTEGQAQWKAIETHFNVDQVINYFAVNMCLSHWDGFFNNYFAYHDRKGTGKWLMFPWDQDKTWGFHDFVAPDKPFFDMPLTFGMNGDTPPGGGPADFNPQSWWRPPGHFSGPLLANPEFRKRFLKRTRQILDEIYTEQVFFPIIDDVATRLRPEISVRAQAVGEPEDAALKRFESNIASLKEHLVKRREFLLNTPELKAPAAAP